jgi:thioredoxin-related protein
VKYDIRKWPALGLVLAFSLNAASGQAASVPPAQNLRMEARHAEQKCVPLLLEFSALACDYCRLLEREVLNPTLLNRDYDRRVMMRKVLIDSPVRLVDFDGSETTGEALAGRYKVYVTPTLLFLDRKGRELTERMIGVTTLDFYAGYLDMALDAARATLQRGGACEETAD